MKHSAQDIDRLRRRLGEIYGPDGEAWTPRFAGGPPAAAAGRAADRWDERDVVLIAYPDHVRARRRPCILCVFLARHRFEQIFRSSISCRSFPIRPTTASVIDYRSVDPRWPVERRPRTGARLRPDVRPGAQPRLGAEPVVPGVSARQRPYVRYFHVDPAADLSAVTRPRSLPLLTEFETDRGPRHLWTTFSADQVDLNYAEPRVLLEIAEVLLDYARRGARIIRLDAVAYLWKQVGTSCIHLPETHAVIRFLRQLLALAAPGALLLTETNVPHEENISYFGRGDEAHLVYQFSLPPLVLDAFLNEDSRPLVGWLHRLGPAPPGAAFLNFTARTTGSASAPGRPGSRGRCSGWPRRSAPAAAWSAPGTARRQPVALQAERHLFRCDHRAGQAARRTLQVRRFLSSQALMLGLRGIPACTSPASSGPATTPPAGSQGRRRINRRKFPRAELDRASPAREPRGRVLAGYRRLLAVRAISRAFHPTRSSRRGRMFRRERSRCCGPAWMSGSGFSHSECQPPEPAAQQLPAGGRARCGN